MSTPAPIIEIPANGTTISSTQRFSGTTSPNGDVQIYLVTPQGNAVFMTYIENINGEWSAANNGLPKGRADIIIREIVNGQYSDTGKYYYQVE